MYLRVQLARLQPYLKTRSPSQKMGPTYLPRKGSTQHPPKGCTTSQTWVRLQTGPHLPDMGALANWAPRWMPNKSYCQTAQTFSFSTNETFAWLSQGLLCGVFLFGGRPNNLGSLLSGMFPNRRASKRTCKTVRLLGAAAPPRGSLRKTKDTREGLPAKSPERSMRNT